VSTQRPAATPADFNFYFEEEGACLTVTKSQARPDFPLFGCHCKAKSAGQQTTKARIMIPYLL
jgi:hypothetical protein